MADLFSMLRSSSRALDTQRFGLDVVGQNIGNANSPGYARRVVDIAAVPPYEQWSAGSGAEVLGVRAIRDRFLDRRVREELSSGGNAAAQANALAQIELLVGAPGSSLDQTLADFFDAFAGLADAATSVPARIEVVVRGQALADSFNELAVRLADAVRDVDMQVRATVDEINGLVDQIAGLNQSLSGMPPTAPEAVHLRDQVIQTVERLSSLVDVQVVEQPGGGFDLTFGSGRTLVVGNQAFHVEVANRAVTGVADITSGSLVVTGEVAGGRLGGLIEVRDSALPAYQAQLDQLAYAVANRVNAVHAAGFDLSGTAGQAFFQGLVNVEGAATAFTMNAAITAPGGELLVAASGSPGAAGDNQTARALSALRDEAFVGGATPAQAWAQLVYLMGRDARAAIDESASRTQVLRQVENLRDGVSGVSLDEEAANMLRFQRAYEANARYFKTIDELLSVLIDLA